MKKCFSIALSLLAIVFAQTDTSPPTVTIATTSTEVTSASTVFLAAVASDNVGIARVDFYKGDLKLFEDTEAPYSVSVNLDATDAPSVNFSAIAVDAAGNQTRSNTATIVVSIAGTTAPVAQPVTPEIPTAQTSFAAQADRYDAIVNTPLVVGVTASSRAAVQLQGSVLDNDNAAANATVSAPASVDGGSLSMNANGSFSFVPDAGYVGAVSFEYTVTSNGESSSASVNINVQEVDATLSGNQKIWYVDGLKVGGSGTATDPFRTLIEARDASLAGDIIFVFSGDYSCVNECYIMRDNQQLIGEGAGLNIAGLSIVAAAQSPRLVATQTTAVILANDSTVAGLSLLGSNVGIRGSDVLTGTLSIENVTIESPTEFGVIIDESDAADSTTGAQHSLVLTDVTVNNAGKIGIISNDASTVNLTNVRVTGVRIDASDGFSGRGVQIESEFNTTANLNNLSIAATLGGSAEQELVGLYILKNNSFGNASTTTNLNVNLSNSSIDFGATTNTLGTRVAAFAGGSGFPADTGSIILSGSNNTVSASSVALFTTGEASVSGTVELSGVSYPQ